MNKEKRREFGIDDESLLFFQIDGSDGLCGGWAPERWSGLRTIAVGADNGSAVAACSRRSSECYEFRAGAAAHNHTRRVEVQSR